MSASKRLFVRIIIICVAFRILIRSVRVRRRSISLATKERVIISLGVCVMLGIVRRLLTECAIQLLLQVVIDCINIHGLWC